MPGMDLDLVLDQVVPDWDRRPPENPPGNILASRLRTIMEDSKSIFQRSAYTSQHAREQRWTSTFKTDYRDLTATKRTASAPDGTHKDKMFMRWNVPDRVTTGDGSKYSARNIRSSFESAKVKPSFDSKEATQLPQLDEPSPRLVEHRSVSAVPCTPRLSTGIAKLRPRENNQYPSEVPVGNDLNKHTYPRFPKGYKISELLDRYYQPCSNAEEWLEKATPGERKAVESALLAIQKSGKTDVDSQSVDRWLKDSTPAERVVALQFFEMVGSKLRPNNAPQRDRINQIIAQLRRGRVHPGVLPPANTSTENNRFRYLRLLTPGTRDKKWMYQTWHHLPGPKDSNPVDNRGAIMTLPQKITPRHYVIHPELG